MVGNVVVIPRMTSKYLYVTGKMVAVITTTDNRKTDKTLSSFSVLY